MAVPSSFLSHTARCRLTRQEHPTSGRNRETWTSGASSAAPAILLPSLTVGCSPSYLALSPLHTFYPACPKAVPLHPRPQPHPSQSYGLTAPPPQIARKCLRATKKVFSISPTTVEMTALFPSYRNCREKCSLFGKNGDGKKG